MRLISTAVRYVQQLCRALPVDAACLIRDAADAQRIRNFINEQRWRRVPRWSVPLLRPIARLLWLLWCPIAASRLARQSAVPMFGRRWRRSLVEGWLFGRLPSWEPPFADAPVMQVGRLDTRHWARLWNVLGSRPDQLLALDKLASSQRFAALGARVPRLLGEISQHTVVDAAALPWPSSSSVFIKPRHGWQGIGAASVQRLLHPWYRINGSSVMHGKALNQSLSQLAEHDSLLIQELQRPASSTLDLSTETPVELRLTTARSPAGASCLLACAMKVQRPRAHAASILSGALSVPVNPHTGEMLCGLLMHEPAVRHATVPWNGARVAGRTVPEFEQAAQMVLTASQALPGLPVIGWDVLITDAGPVILEANTTLAWWLIHLWHAATGTPSPLLSIVLEWIRVRELESDCKRVNGPSRSDGIKPVGSGEQIW